MSSFEQIWERDREQLFEDCKREQELLSCAIKIINFPQENAAIFSKMRKNLNSISAKSKQSSQTESEISVKRNTKNKKKEEMELSRLSAAVKAAATTTIYNNALLHDHLLNKGQHEPFIPSHSSRYVYLYIIQV